MRICLVNPLFPESRCLVVQQGLLHLAGQVKSTGRQCDIVDYNDPDQNVPYSVLNEYDVVGLSVMTAQLPHAVEIADSLSSSTRVVWGGVHCLLDPLSILQHYPKHYVVSGDGEIPLVRLLDYLERGESEDWLRAQGGISFRTDGGGPHIAAPYFVRNLDDLADVNYYDYPNLEKLVWQSPYFFRDKMPYLLVHSSRGCNWKCTFCINTVYARHNALHRSKSIEKIRRETERVIKDLDIKLVVLQDEDFFSNPKLVEDWQEYAREKGLLWAVNGRFNYFRKMINAERLRRMMDNGLVQIGMSIESGCERLRNEILRKQVCDADISQAIETIRAGAGDRLAVNVSFIVDFPGETQQGKIETMKWMDRLSRSLNVAFSGPQPYRNYPGTELCEKDIPRVRGSLDYYLENTAADGAIKENRRRSWTTSFCQYPLTLYYSRKAPYFRVRDARARPLQYDVEPSEYRGKLSLLNLEFLTIRLRLRLDFWKWFFEPAAIYILFALSKKVRVFYLDTKARIRRAPRKIRRILGSSLSKRRVNVPKERNDGTTPH